MDRAQANLLEIRNLSLQFRTPRGVLKALRNVSVDIPRGHTVGIVGESGCGKSTLISTIMRLLSGNAEITGGEIRFDGQDLLKLDEKHMGTRSSFWPTSRPPASTSRCRARSSTSSPVCRTTSGCRS